MKVSELFSNPKQAGEVGIEIEVEGLNLPPAPQGWKATDDSSLRGEAIEYVVSKPFSRTRINYHLRKLERAYQENNTAVRPSPRQSIHVHLNFQDEEVLTALNFIFLTTILEDTLLMQCGEHRNNNFYCMKMKDAEFFISELENNIRDNRSLFRVLSHDNMFKYGFINPSCLYRYGSIEVRGMEGTDDFKRIKEWIEMLLAIKDYAKKFNNPSELLQDFVVKPISVFIEDVFGKQLEYNEGSIIESARMLKLVSFSKDWSRF